jgi:hypothetical protein
MVVRITAQSGYPVKIPIGVLHLDRDICDWLHWREVAHFAVFSVRYSARDILFHAWSAILPTHYSPVGLTSLHCWMFRYALTTP